MITRAAALLIGGVLILLPLVVAGKVGAFNVIVAAPMFLAALAPRTLGPPIGKGLLLVAALAAFYDPPSSVGFHPNRVLLAAPLFALGTLLAVPALSEGLARTALRQT